MLQIRGDLLINCTFERAFLPFVAFANPFTSPREVTDAYISCYSAPESEVLPFVALPRRERVSRKLEEVWGFSGGGGGGRRAGGERVTARRFGVSSRRVYFS